MRLSVGFFLILFLSLNVAHALDKYTYVVLISLDGVGRDMLGIKGDYLFDLSKKYSSMSNARAVEPPVTINNHAAMFSGLGPESHLMLNNSPTAADAPLKAPTIFKLAKNAGLKVAAVIGKDKFFYLVNKADLDAIRIPGELTRHLPIVIQKEAISVFDELEPNLLFIHFPEADSAGHQFGWNSAFQKWTIRRIGMAVKEIIDHIESKKSGKKVLFLLTSDHGGHEHTHGNKNLKGNYFEIDMKVPVIFVSDEFLRGKLLSQSFFSYDIAPTIASALRLAVPKNWHWKGKALR